MKLRSHKTFPIACIGASAGGLEALTFLFKALSKDTNMAFVVVQHLEPHHKSILAEILSRNTALSVRQVENNTRVKPAYIYVIPPNSYLSISRGLLKVKPRPKLRDGRYFPVDFFMASLAKDRGKEAVGIVLSGTGLDGTAGIKAIKAAGGITFAQDTKTAKYDGMPSSAIASGSIDFILPPQAIAAKLVRIGAHKYEAVSKSARPRLTKEESLDKILILLRDISGTDFVHYKRTTVERRIARRMAFHKMDSCSEYYNYLKENPREAGILYKDILIPVTTFFRDPAVFTAIRKRALPLLLKNRRKKEPVRVWVPACSTGEEVYSFAITIYEFLEENNIKPHFQIFGTDLNDIYINKARAATYSEDIRAHVSAARLRSFFTKTEMGYKIAKHIRDKCIFARQDITNDPPLSNMDIASCRNLLIYLDAFLQNKVLSALNYSLKPQGLLILGTAETFKEDMFAAVSKKYKIYLKNISAAKPRALINRILPSSMPGKKIGAARKKVSVAGAGPALAGKYGKKPEAGKGFAGQTRPGKKNHEYGGKGRIQLQKELAETKKRLYDIIEEKDTFNEELKAANEEIQSSNEELQSTNEELETSKEELQSTNEELLTVNDELQDKNAELTQLNSDLANILTSVNIPLIIVKRDLRIMRFTPMARKVMNLIPGDVDRPLGDIKLNIDIPHLEETILDVIENMVLVESEVQDREGRWYSVRVRPYRTLDNKIDGAVISLIDIDLVKRAQDEIRGALDYANSIIETVREPLLVLDKDMRILSANKSFYQNFTTVAQEIKNKPLYGILGHKFDTVRLRCALKEILSKKTYFDNFEMAIELPEIGKRMISLSARQVHLRGESKPMILLALEDITERKTAEEVLRQDKEKTQKLLDLQNKFESAKRLSDIGQLAMTVAHEMRNPLAAIKMAAYNIKRKTKDSSLLERHIHVIDKKVFESDQIINNLLFYSRIRPPSYEEVSINSLLEECIELAERQCARASRVSFKKYIKNDKIEADPIQLKELFLNILINACDALREPGGKVEVALREKGAVMEIIIQDNGAGIDKKHLSNVFAPFFTTKAKGIGLGLTISRHIVDMHGGIIRIESKPGKGTKVIIGLPRRKQNLP